MSPPFVTAEADARALAARGALFAAHDSGGKDGQAMLIRVARVVPREQLVVVHETLGQHAYPDAEAHARAHAEAARVPFVVAAARDRMGAPKSFFDLTDARAAKRPDVSAWPLPRQRQCTSDLKRDPGDREVKRYAAAHGFRLIVSCAGLRAEESDDRAAMPSLSRYRRGCLAAKFSKSGERRRRARIWWTWLPVQHLTRAEVFGTIHGAGQRAHWLYYPAPGRPANDRFSCVFCIFGSRNDLRNGAILRPDLYAQYVEREGRYGYTLHPSRKSLVQLTGLTPAQAHAQRRALPRLPTETP